MPPKGLFVGSHRISSKLWRILVILLHKPKELLWNFGRCGSKHTIKWGVAFATECKAFYNCPLLPSFMPSLKAHWEGERARELYTTLKKEQRTLTTVFVAFARLDFNFSTKASRSAFRENCRPFTFPADERSLLCCGLRVASDACRLSRGCVKINDANIRVEFRA